MEWVVGLVMVIVIPIAMLVWWIPYCDKKGIEKARRRIQTEQNK